MTLPNIITLVRLGLVPVVVWSIASGEMLLAFWLFLAAGLSDALDGFLAKRFHMQSELGAYLDPVADKALLVSIYVTLAVSGIIPRWVAIAVVSRDVMIVGAILLAMVMGKPLAIRPLVISKINTAVQIAFAATVLALAGFEIAAPGLVSIGLLMVGLSTALSAGAYLIQWARHMAA